MHSYWMHSGFLFWQKQTIRCFIFRNTLVCASKHTSLVHLVNTVLHTDRRSPCSRDCYLRISSLCIADIRPKKGKGVSQDLVFLLVLHCFFVRLRLESAVVFALVQIDLRLSICLGQNGPDEICKIKHGVFTSCFKCCLLWTLTCGLHLQIDKVTDSSGSLEDTRILYKST